MRKSRRHEYRQAYNAQAAVDADGSQLVLGARVSVCASDRNELVADVDAIPAAVGAADRVLADSGYATGSEVSQLAGRGVEVLVATGAEGQRRQHDFRPGRWCMNRNWPATILTQRLLTCRYRTTLARQGPSSDLGCCMRAAPRPFALLACALEGQCR